MKRLINLRVVFSLLLWITLSSVAFGNGKSTTVQGGFCSLKNQAPIPGLMVSMVHPQLGRSNPAYTNEYGYFQMFNIPMHKVAYYLEVYWGKRLIFRSQIMVQGPISLPVKCI
ncbi:MAG: hypothetical protein HRU06_06055 [Oceanospirillaceae bacterium]|nr:hypothetical protein [Oceanospirillaceae bacterium]